MKKQMLKRLFSLAMAGVMATSVFSGTMFNSTITVQAEENTWISVDSLTDTDTAAPAADAVVPDANQYKYQKDELAAFCHFGPNTFNEIEWGENYGDSHPSEIFNLTEKFDAKTLVETIAEAGFKKLIITAKHHDGFCIWPSAYTEYDSEAAGYDGDILEDISYWCTELDIDMGLYLSPWDINAPSYGYYDANGNPITDTVPDATGAVAGDALDYNDYYNNQLQEILGNDKYGNNGHFVEVWMDGAKGSGANSQEYDFQRWFATIQANEGIANGYDADCMLFGAQAYTTVRWIGNEDGYAHETTWAKSNVDYDANTIDSGVKTDGVFQGFENGNKWTVPECDARITSGWFWGNNKKTPKTVKELAEMYFRSVGHNGTLLLNIPPNSDGTIDEAIIQRTLEFGDAIKNTFDEDMTAAEGVSIKASAVRGNDVTYSPANVLDGDDSTYWTVDDGATTGQLLIDLGAARTFDVVSLEEAIQFGQRITSYKVEYRNGESDTWKTFDEGTTVGSKRLGRDYPVKGSQLRITVSTETDIEGKTAAVPMLSEVGVYKAEGGFEVGSSAPEGMEVIDIEDIDSTDGTYFESTGTWTSETGNQYTNGTNQYSSNGTKTLHFTGSKVYLIGTKDPSHGNMYITIDGDTENKEDVSTTATPRATAQVIYESPDLEDGEHTLLLETQGSPIGIEAAFVINNGGVGMVGIENAEYTMNEDTTIDIKLVRVGGSESEATVILTPNPGTAIQDDFNTELIHTVTFAPGETEKTVTVQTSRNTNPTGDQYFTVELSAVTEGVMLGFNDKARITILDTEYSVEKIQELIAECEALNEEHYTAVSWEELQESLAHTREKITGELNRREIQRTYDNLQEAKDALRSTHTQEDPFVFPSEAGETKKLQAEFFTLDATGAAEGKEVRIGDKDWNGDGENDVRVVDWFEEGNKIQVPYTAKYAGTYTVTMTYRSGRGDSNPNAMNWSGENIESGSLDVYGEENATTTHTAEFDVVITAPGTGVLTFTADAKASPVIDYFEIQPKEFVYKEYTITATAGEHGAITPAGETVLSEVESQEFIITPEDGYEVENVLVNDTSAGAVNTYTVTNPTENMTISATFKLLNQVKNATMSASSVEENLERLNAAKANDGNTGTRWASNYDAPSTQWLKATFAETTLIKHIKITLFTRDTAPVPSNVSSFSIKYTDASGEEHYIVKDYVNAASGSGYVTNISLVLEEAVEAESITICEFAANASQYNNISITEVEAYSGELPPEPILTVDAAVAHLETLAVKDRIVDAQTDTFTLPTIEGYTVELNGVDFEQIIADDLTIVHPLTDKAVQVSYVVTDEQGNSQKTGDIEYIVKGLYTQEDTNNSKPVVIPEIQEWYSDTTDTLAVSSLTKVTYSDDALEAIVDEFIADYEDFTGITLEKVKGDAAANAFNFTKEAPDALLGEEGYTLDILSDRINVKSESITGNMYGMQTILQMYKQNAESFSVGSMRDYPRFEVRGLLLDIARKPIAMNMIRDIGRTMRYYKMNDYQLHLSDNYIFLENYGKYDTENEAFKAYEAYRLECDVTNEAGESPTAKDYYITKAEMQEYIQSERALGMNIVPEIDMPAHATSFTKIWPELMVENKVSPLNSSRPLIDHFDVSKQEAIDKIKEIFDDYTTGDNPTFDAETTVHVGADEFVDNYTAYRVFVNQIVPHVKETNTVRMWGGLTWIDDGETEIIQDAIENVEMNLWSSDWADGQEMYDMGYKLINTIDDYGYMVPSGSLTRANAYGDLLNVSRIFDSFAANRVKTGSGYVTLPSGDDQMLGAAFAIWSDNIDKNASGLSESDLYYRFFDALPFYAEKTWAATGKEKDSADALLELAQEQGTGPNTNPYYQEDTVGDTYESYDFASMEDTSENDRDLTVQTAELEDGKLVLKGGNSYATTPIDKLGNGNELSFDITLTEVPQPGDIIFEATPEYGTHDIRIMEDGKLGFTRELYNYYFDYELPIGKTVNIKIVAEQQDTTLYVNGALVGEATGKYIHNDIVKKTGITHSTYAIPLERIGSETNAIVAVIDNVQVKKTTSEDTYNKAGWTGTTNSETVHNQTEGLLTYAFDDDSATIWHSNWQGATDKLTGSNSFYAELDFGQAYTINQFSFIPRQDGQASGQITKADLYIKLNVDDEWTLVAENQVFAADAAKKTFWFDEQEVRYIKFVAKESNDGWVAVSEFDVANAPYPTYTIYTQAEGNGTTGASQEVNAGEAVTVTATPGKCNAFTGWYDSFGELVSEEMEYTFTPSKNTVLIAKFKVQHAETTVVKGKVEATCAKDGYTGDKVCAGCEMVIESGSVIPKTGAHTWNAGVITTEPTATQPGTKTYTCTVCGTTKLEAMEPTGNGSTTAPGGTTGGSTTTPDKEETEVKLPKKGTKLTYKGATYKVVKSALKNGTVSFVKPKKNVASVTIPATIKIKGITYKVTAIEKNAFKGNKKVKKVTVGRNVILIGANAFNNCKKLKTITIKTTKLTKKSLAKNAFKGIKKYTKITVPKKKLKNYKKIFKSRGLSTKVKVKK